ncbi:MAG: terminase family protein [Firmicutes bacterium]|nr:terminase family protein [Candidatus Colivicinus equi]
MPQIKTQIEIEKDKQERIMETVAWRAGYYRANPHRYVSEVLGLSLKWFQQILLWAMMNYNFVMYLAARGQGKTYLTALFCCVRCILFPGTKIVVSSGTLKQANEVLLKIQDDFMKQSSILRSEIEKCNIGQNDASIYFKNSSWIKTRTSSENSRSARANCIVVDEFRMVDETVINTVLRKFLTSPRQPKYLRKPEYAHLQERNKEIYMSSAYFKSSWAYKKAQSYTLNFFDDTKKYFIVGLPYQVSVRDGLLSRSQLEDEMSEADYNELVQQMEMECLWFGDTDGSLFKFDEIDSRRRIKKAYMPLEFYREIGQIPKVKSTEKRILSLDVALMKSTKKKKNDAAALFINDLIQVNDTAYQSNFVYAETWEGLTTDKLGIITMRYFYEYNCTDLVLDTNGLGLGVYDFIIKDQYDEVTGKTYKAITCINDKDMASRCNVQDATKAVWSVKASSSFNNEICVLLRTGIQNGKINFLVQDQDLDNIISDYYKGYNKLTPTDKAKLQLSYVQTTLMVYELVKLDHEIKNGNIRVFESSDMRKDRYSSVAYSYWCACQLEYKLKPKQNNTNNLVSLLPIKQGYRSR